MHSDSKFYGECENCHTKHFFIARVVATLPNGVEVKGRSYLCKKCRAAVKSMLK